MKSTITITRKGQTTLPATVRHKLGLGKAGGILQMSFDERRGELIISKPVSVDDLSKKLSKHIRAGTEPLVNVDEYYQANRQGS